MTDKITLELTLDELKLIDKYVELNDETQSVFDKIKYAYPQPQMNLQQEGEYAVVSYHDKVYYRLEGDVTFLWYIKKGVSANHRVPTLVMVEDAETERLLEGLYYNHIQVKKEKEQRTKTPEKEQRTKTPVKEAFREAVKQGIIPEVDKVSDVFMNEMVEKLKGQTLYDVIADWWDEIFMNNNEAAVTIESLVDEISLWLPKEHDTNSYKWNECIRMIKGKLR